MNSRPFVGFLLLGLAVGSMLGSASACGVGPSTVTCGRTSCDGCCTGNKCVASPHNARITSCGQNGAACADCGSRPCVDFKCAGAGGGGGSSGVCGPGNCSGCCSGTSTSSVCITSPSATNCGANGGLCATCGAGRTCLAGACQTLDGGAGQVGLACLNDGDCAPLGPNHLCKQKTTSGANTYQGGYCTRTCVNDLDCPTSALCLGPQPGYGENDSVCWARCASAQECRAGYDCYAVGGGDSACWIAPLPPFDAGPPADKIGQPCGTDGTCQNPPDDGVCLADTFPDGGPSAFTGGYCTAPCDDTSHCSTDGGALCISLVTFGACAQSCSTPLQGQGACRTGYVCRSIRASPDGGILPQGFCWPSCQTAGCAVGVCQPNGYCA